MKPNMEGLPEVQISLTEFQDRLCRFLLAIQARFLEQDTKIEALSKRCTDLEARVTLTNNRLNDSVYQRSFARD